MASDSKSASRSSTAKSASTTPGGGTPIDGFKRSLSASTKALAGRDDLEVSYGGDVAGMVRDQIMLPSLPPRPKAEVIAKARGEADALALRIALHDAATHADNLPRSGPARQVFEALEQARVEALGGRHLAGLADNLSAALDARATRRGFDKADIAKDDASFAEAVGLFARERLTGPQPAAPARTASWTPGARRSPSAARAASRR